MTRASLKVIALLGLCGCASVTVSQMFELSTESATMPPPTGAPSSTQTVSLNAKFGSCSKSALGNIEKVRESDQVDSLEVWVIVRDVKLSSDASFSGIENLHLELVTANETVTVCDRTLSAAEQRSSTIDCEFEKKVSVEELCADAGSTQMAIQLTVDTGAVTLTRIGATITVETEVEADVSL
jgi:hypothetical protein